jgi:glycine dehydrogenase
VKAVLNSDILALTIVKSPAEMGADIAVGGV